MKMVLSKEEVEAIVVSAVKDKFPDGTPLTCSLNDRYSTDFAVVSEVKPKLEEDDA